MQETEVLGFLIGCFERWSSVSGFLFSCFLCVPMFIGFSGYERNFNLF